MRTPVPANARRASAASTPPPPPPAIATVGCERRPCRAMPQRWRTGDPPGSGTTPAVAAGNYGSATSTADSRVAAAHDRGQLDRPPGGDRPGQADELRVRP